MRLSPFIIAALLCLAVSAATPVAMAFPVTPHAFCGNVTVNGLPAPDGTPVSATVREGTLNPGEHNPVLTVGGSYGRGGADPLVVGGDIPNGAIIDFYVFGVKTNQTAVFEEGGGPTTVDLSITWKPVAFASKSPEVADELYQ